MITRADALEALRIRKETAPNKIDNSGLHAGSPMYFYCVDCGWLSDVKEESYTSLPRKFCSSCKFIRDMGWNE